MFFNGIDLKANYNFVLKEESGRGMPPIISKELTFDFVDGVLNIPDYDRFDKRNLTITGYVYGRPGEDVYQKKTDLIKLITTCYSEEKELKFDDGKTFYVRLANEPLSYEKHGALLNAKVFEITFNFVCYDPFAYGEEKEYLIANENNNLQAYAPTKLVSFTKEILNHEPQTFIEALSNIKIIGNHFDIVESEGFIILDSDYLMDTTFQVDEYDGYGDVGYIWNLYTEGAGDGYEWDTKNPSTALNILTTDTVQDPSTVLTIIDGGFIETSYIWNYNNPSSALEVQ